jgi:hypothetical protein
MLFEEWHLQSACGVVSMLPTDPDSALAVLDLARQVALEEPIAKKRRPAWMVPTAERVASILAVTGVDEALAVLALAREIVTNVSIPYVARVRGARRRGRAAA